MLSPFSIVITHQYKYLSQVVLSKQLFYRFGCPMVDKTPLHTKQLRIHNKKLAVIYQMVIYVLYFYVK